VKYSLEFLVTLPPSRIAISRDAKLSMSQREKELSCLSTNLANILGFEHENPLEKAMKTTFPPNRKTSPSKERNSLLEDVDLKVIKPPTNIGFKPNSNHSTETKDAKSNKSNEFSKLFGQSKLLDRDRKSPNLSSLSSIKLNPMVKEFVPRKNKLEKPPKIPEINPMMPMFLQPPYERTRVPYPPPAPPPPKGHPIPPGPPRYPAAPRRHPPRKNHKKQNYNRSQPQDLEPAISRMVVQLEASDRLQFIPHIRILKQLLMEGKTTRRDIINQLMSLPERSEPFKFLQSLLDHGENLILKDSAGLDLSKDATLAESDPHNKDYFNLLYLFEKTSEFLQRVYIRGQDGQTKKSCRFGTYDVNNKFGITFTTLWKQENSHGKTLREACSQVETGTIKKNCVTVWNHTFESQCSSCDVKAYEHLMKMKGKLKKYKRITRGEITTQALPVQHAQGVPLPPPSQQFSSPFMQFDNAPQFH